MRQTLSKGLVVAAAATSVLSLYGTWASADSRTHGTPGDSAAALSGNAVQDPAPQPLTGDRTFASRTDVAAVTSAARAVARQARGVASDGTTPAAVTPSKVPSTPPASKAPSTPSSDEGYGDDEPSTPSYGYGGYGEDEPCDCYGEEETPTPTPTPTKPPTKETTPPPTPAPSKTPPAKSTPPAPPEMAETGAESTIGAVAASGALLAAGTVLYRRGRAASRR